MTWWTTLVGDLARMGLTWLSRRRLPQIDGALQVAGSENSVEVLRDRWGVPHIYAHSEHDLYFAQGFVHAQDRLWQMEFNRRLVAGRLAEMLGAKAVPVDRWIRTIGMRRVAEAEIAALTADAEPAMDVLVAYAAGANACIAQGRLPIEFTLLRHRPEPWVPEDTVAWAKMMSWDLSVNWVSELARQLLIDRLGPERAAELEPSFAGRRPTILPAGLPADAGTARVGGSALGRADAARPFIGPTATDGVGSNSWVVSGTRSATGAPLLANDMHLGLSIPAIWYENHLVAGDVNLSGITFPGVPGIVAGHNGHVAWGYTNGFADVQDNYVEHLRRTEDGRVEAEYRGAWEEARIIHEEIRVKGGDSVMEDVVVTRHGPIINSVAGDMGAEAPLALRWTSLDPDSTISTLYAMCRARDCSEFREVLRSWSAPIQNVVYADTRGNVAYSLPGKIPVRAMGDGRVPAPGWSGDFEWEGYIPFDDLPHMFNPPKGFIATANNRVVDESYDCWLGEEYCIGDRAQRIVELIESFERVDVQSIRQMHFDQVSPHARNLARFLGALPVDGADHDLAPVVALMSDWNGTLGPDSAAAAIYEVFAREMIRLLLEPKLGDLTGLLTGMGPNPNFGGLNMFGERSWEWLEHNLEQPAGYWFDLGNGETRDDCARLALRRSVGLLRQWLGDEISDWSWGKLHQMMLGHVLGQAPPLDRLLNRGPVPLGGDGGTVWATGASRADVRSQQIVGPVYRMIIDLGDVRNSVSVLLPGQSGRVGSPHYDDQIDAWFAGDYHPMLFAREDVEAAASHRLRLMP